jgi:hypothetical protein
VGHYYFGAVGQYCFGGNSQPQSRSTTFKQPLPTTHSTATQHRPLKPVTFPKSSVTFTEMRINALEQEKSEGKAGRIPRACCAWIRHRRRARGGNDEDRILTKLSCFRTRKAMSQAQ